MGANENHHDSSITPRSPSQGLHSPAKVVERHSLSIPRSPALHAKVSSPPLSPRLPSHASDRSRTPSFSSAVNVVDLLASETINGTKPVFRDWTKIPLRELVQGQKLVFVDGDTPVEEACQVLFPWIRGPDGRCLLINN
jgi:hypothetical protein